MRNPIRRSLTLLLPALLIACGGDEPVTPETPENAAGTGAGIPESFWLASAPADAVDVGSAHGSAQDGDTVVVRGIVGGSLTPFVEGLAAFTIVDPSLVSCEGPDDHCPTPWDYCCEDPTAIANNSATIELRDGGAPLAVDPRGFHGLDNLSRVVVEGTAHRDGGGNLIVAATGIHMQP